VSVDQHGGRTERQGPEMRADQLDFAEREGGGGNDVVNAGIREDFSGGLRTRASHGDDLLTNKAD
jgi:hypothetical protein